MTFRLLKVYDILVVDASMRLYQTTVGVFPIIIDNFIRDDQFRVICMCLE